MLIRRPGLRGLPQRKLRKGAKVGNFASLDLVRRNFGAAAPDVLWVTDITEHPTQEGKVYCCAVLDAFSRRIAGWSIDSSQTTALVTNAFSMAVSQRRPSDGSIIHSDRLNSPSSPPRHSATRSRAPASLLRWAQSVRPTTTQ